jgi:hypothetical protein
MSTFARGGERSDPAALASRVASVVMVAARAGSQCVVDAALGVAPSTSDDTREG